jgi:hypothetical protein
MRWEDGELGREGLGVLRGLPMSDEQVRELERRWRASGSIEDEAKYFAERMRVGDLPRRRLELAAYCGHAAALLVLGGEPPSLELVPWIEGIDRWGKEAYVRGLVAMAEASFHLWKEPEAPRPRRRRSVQPASPNGQVLLQRALDAARAWLQCPCAHHEKIAAEAEEASREVSYTPALGATTPEAVAAATAAIAAAGTAGIPENEANPVSIWSCIVAEHLKPILGEDHVRGAICNALIPWTVGLTASPRATDEAKKRNQLRSTSEAAMIEDFGSVLRQRGRNWTVVTTDPVLTDFLARNGDYALLARHPKELDLASGGNYIDWTVKGDVVTLKHQDVPGIPPVSIKRAVLEEVVRLLAISRGVTGVVPAGEEETPKPAAKKKTKPGDRSP